jgi:hypothetical protein
MLPAYLAHFQRVELVCNSQWGRALQMPDKQTAWKSKIVQSMNSDPETSNKKNTSKHTNLPTKERSEPSLVFCGM